MKLLKALTAGIRTTNGSYRMIALLYAVNLIIAGILAWGFHSVLARTLGDSMSLENLVKDFDYTVYGDFMFKYGGRISAIMSQLSWLIFFYLLLNTLLGGGTIALLKNGDERFSMSSFFENCGAYFFRFLRLFLIFGVILFFVGVAASMLFGFLYSALTSNAVSEVWPFTFAIILFLLFLFVVMIVVMMADYAKVITVVDEARSMLRTSWQAIKFVIRHFVSTVGLQLSIILLILITVIIYLVLENQIGMATPFAILIMFIIQQVSVGFKVWTRVLTFAGELELSRTFEPEPTLAVPVSVVPEPTSVPVIAPTAEPVAPAALATLEKKRRASRRPAAKKVVVRRKPKSGKSR